MIALLLAIAVAASFPLECANCRCDLTNARRHRRRVPRLGGKRRIVCGACARAIDAQGTLADNEGALLGDRSAR